MSVESVSRSTAPATMVQKNSAPGAIVAPEASVSRSCVPQLHAQPLTAVAPLNLKATIPAAVIAKLILGGGVGPINNDIGVRLSPASRFNDLIVDSLSLADPPPHGGEYLTRSNFLTLVGRALSANSTPSDLAPSCDFHSFEIIPAELLPSRNVSLARSNIRLDFTAEDDTGRQSPVDIYIARSARDTWECAAFWRHDASGIGGFPYATPPFIIDSFRVDRTTAQIISAATLAMLPPRQEGGPISSPLATLISGGPVLFGLLILLSTPTIARHPLLAATVGSLIAIGALVRKALPK